MDDGPDEGLHVDQIARHQAFFEQIGADVAVEAGHSVVGLPVRIRFVIDPPAQRLGCVLDDGGLDEGGLLRVADEAEQRRKLPFVDFQDAEHAQEVLEARLFSLGSVEQVGQGEREKFLAGGQFEGFVEGFALGLGEQAGAGFDMPGAIADSVEVAFGNQPGHLVLAKELGALLLTAHVGFACRLDEVCVFETVRVLRHEAINCHGDGDKAVADNQGCLDQVIEEAVFRGGPFG